MYKYSALSPSLKDAHLLPLNKQKPASHCNAPLPVVDQPEKSCSTREWEFDPQILLQQVVVIRNVTSIKNGDKQQNKVQTSPAPVSSTITWHLVHNAADHQTICKRNCIPCTSRILIRTYRRSTGLPSASVYTTSSHPTF